MSYFVHLFERNEDAKFPVVFERSVESMAVKDACIWIQAELKNEGYDLVPLLWMETVEQLEKWLVENDCFLTAKLVCPTTEKYFLEAVAIQTFLGWWDSQWFLIFDDKKEFDSVVWC